MHGIQRIYIQVKGTQAYSLTQGAIPMLPEARAKDAGLLEGRQRKAERRWGWGKDLTYVGS